MMLLTVTEPVVVHPEWVRVLRALHDAGLAREIHEKQLRPRLDYHASGPPKAEALEAMLARYYTGDGDEERGRLRRQTELRRHHTVRDHLKRVA
jgi:hypothetical protein